MHEIYRLLEIAGMNEATPGNTGRSGQTPGALPGAPIVDTSSVPTAKKGIISKVAKKAADVALFGLGAGKVNQKYKISDKIQSVASTSGRSAAVGEVKEKLNRLANQFRDLNKNSIKKYFITGRFYDGYSRTDIEYTLKAPISATSQENAFALARPKLIKEFKELKHKFLI